jgi:DNA-binding CsgD family transcriptional regulator
MKIEAINDLSERQKQCLRHLYQNLSVKEIALELGLSPHTVNEHLRQARRTLGVSRSMQAARLLVRAEGNNRSVSDAIGVEDDDVVDHDQDATMTAEPTRIARNRYNLTILQRIGLIVAIAFIAVALAGALLVGADAITRIFVGYEIDISDKPYRK